MAALEQHPPPQPSQQAVDLLVSVGQQQKYLDANGLLPPAGHPGALDAFQVCSFCAKYMCPFDTCKQGSLQNVH